MALRPSSYWEGARVALLLGREVTSVDPSRRRLKLADQGTVNYQQLIWAAGGYPRRIDGPGFHLAGVHVVRSRADVDRIRSELDGATRVVVIGGGYIGLEAAAALSKLGKSITLIESLDRVLARVAGVELSRFFEIEHRARGVDMRTAAAVHSLVGQAGRVAAVRLTSGEIIPAELVIVGIGIVPAVEPLLAVGAKGGNGVWVDRQCRTSLEHIYAIGDCALHENSYAGGSAVRLESVQNAGDQGAVAAKAILGNPVSYDSVPWFWSNQYDLKLQTIGLSVGHDVAVLRGEPSARSFSVVYLRGGVVIALDCLNSPRDYAHGRKLIIQRVTVDPERLRDTTVPLTHYHRDTNPAR